MVFFYVFRAENDTKSRKGVFRRGLFAAGLLGHVGDHFINDQPAIVYFMK